jgi:hypothetical protein
MTLIQASDFSCSDKDLKTLTSEIHNAIIPPTVQPGSTRSTEKDNDGGSLPFKVVEAAIKRVAKRINYGVDGGLQVRRFLLTRSL